MNIDEEVKYKRKRWLWINKTSVDEGNNCD